MGRMSPEQRKDLAVKLGCYNTAAPELVFAAIDWRTHPDTRRQAADAVPPIARNLLEAETELAALRSIVARLIVENDRGEEHSLADLRQELKRAGIDLTREYTAADAMAHAQESETR